eukprot:CAMPEP_0118649980 /NCGR_PEP_ID=MMETSP0785-20121206/10001_1 /TAXON_ID=91992 /ORGANISM="Bolidomonas pacifica, Strain CCMP 1866" /LENGTH=76 /DNA_ID=CAMNT_0006542321 /DNA_START=170 /DNA_END=400 /DNA_ORIENTATION=+
MTAWLTVLSLCSAPLQSCSVTSFKSASLVNLDSQFDVGSSAWWLTCVPGGSFLGLFGWTFSPLNGGGFISSSRCIL